ncbi:hypothetical protein Tco_1154818 [Tanacetum coccineum]
MTSMAGIREIRIVGMDPDIENTTLNEYLEYEGAKERQLWDNVRSRRSLTNYDEADVDSFHRNKSNTFSYPYSHNLTPPHPCFLPVQPNPKNYFVSTNDDDLEEDQEDDGDNGDTFDMWDITVEDVERIRQFLTSSVLDVIEDVIQPLIPKTLQPSYDDYVALATKPIFYKLLEDNILNVAMVDEEADPTRDLEELERLLVENPYFTEIQVHSIITKTEPFIHTQPMSPLYEIFESYKSSTKPYKVDREMKSPSKYGLKSSFPYPVANEHPYDVYCYFHPHLIPSEGMDTLLPSSSRKVIKIETGSTCNSVVNIADVASVTT